ncbi:MAG: radical SAM protein [Theionarchaea archaeon]|nr:radical SAM protein [Theionarchaea archaeon]MBU7037360.1 radical SAM protein [Theionarchaea archaeon]
MILQSTVPYREDIPNAALGYLKGFLTAEGIPVTALYWNLILARKISEFYRVLADYSKEMGLFHPESVGLYICRNLLTDHSDNSNPTKFDLIFSSIFSREERSEMISSIQDEIYQYIQRNRLHEVPVVGFTLKTYQWMLGSYLIQCFKEMNTDVTIVIGGITDESQAITYMKIFELADFAIWGEGEFPLVHLVRTLEEGTDVSGVPNLVYRSDKTILSTKVFGDSYSLLDSYPFADHSDYFETVRRFDPFRKYVTIPIWGSRGCPWDRCKFCTSSGGYKYRFRSPENIVEEIEVQSKKHRADDFIFVDTELAGNKKRFLSLLRLLMQSIVSRKRPYRLSGEISPLSIDRETAQYIKRAGFVSLQIGFEAVTDTLLRKMQKRQMIVHNIETLKIGGQHSLPLRGLNIIRGIPTETAGDVLESCINLKFWRFLLSDFRIRPTFFLLHKRSLFDREMAEEEKEKWKADSLWDEIVPARLVPESDRFEFSSFRRDRFDHHHLWDIFEDLLMFYTKQKSSYEWIEYPDGSLVEEKGFRTHKLALNREQTDILAFCDSVKSLCDVEEKFSHLCENELFELLNGLKTLGLLYYDKESGKAISILDTSKRRTEAG